MEKEFGNIIRSLPSNKAPGPDKVTARILKDSLPITLAKIAEVIPVLKSGDPDEPSNTRPISHLPIMSKVCVRAARSQFVNFLDQNKKNSKLKSGNRIFHSTETALLYFTDGREKSQKNVSVIVLLDISKAFDIAYVTICCVKTLQLGVSIAACDWFGSYLSQRIEN